jgi:hypothetical protein
MPKLRKPKIGRPRTVKDGQYLTVLLRGDRFRTINRIGGPAPQTQPATIRALIDAGPEDDSTAMMDTRPCAWCSKPFATPYPNKLTCSPKCHAARRREHARQLYRERDSRRVTCRRCGGPMPPGVRTSSVRYCSDGCRFNTAESVEGGTHARTRVAVACSKQNPKALRPQLYCGNVCRRAAFKARHADDEGVEISVVDLDQAPKRLAVAKLLDRFDCTGFFDHGAKRAEWMNPNDKRASR